MREACAGYSAMARRRRIPISADPSVPACGSTRISTAISAATIAACGHPLRPRVRQIAREAAGLGVSEIFVTGGEPFLLAEIGDILAACAAAAPTTVLTNGMLLVGRRLETLRLL